MHLPNALIQTAQKRTADYAKRYANYGLIKLFYFQQLERTKYSFFFTIP